MEEEEAGEEEEVEVEGPGEVILYRRIAVMSVCGRADVALPAKSIHCGVRGVYVVGEEGSQATPDETVAGRQAAIFYTR